jgi:hypothetical protein
MSNVPPFGLKGFVLLLAVLAAAGGARAWYLLKVVGETEAPPPLQAQDSPGPLNELAWNLKVNRAFSGHDPLTGKEESTAHMAPGYPYALSLAGKWLQNPDQAIRWAQCALGALAAGLYFLFARRAFYGFAVAGLAGLLCAINPFWIINTAEINDGVLATFLLAACLFLGTRGAQEGEAVTSLVFGLMLAALSLVRAALLPFAVVAMLWFLWRCRAVRRGWLCGLLAFLGFANGVAPWTVRNLRTFNNEVVPISDAMFLHLWEGNNRYATGGPLTEQELRDALPEAWREKILAEANQPRRYNLLARPVLDAVLENPTAALDRRLPAAQYFFFGKAYADEESPGLTPGDDRVPAWLAENYNLILLAPIVAMLVLGFLGWRWTYPWRREAMLATLAVIWVPLPYILSHAERLWGPRLPLDGVLLCLAAFALVRLVPGVGQRLVAGPAGIPLSRMR